MSGLSSWQYLDNVICPGVPVYPAPGIPVDEYQFAPEQMLARGYLAGMKFVQANEGACRIMGGGFQGATLAFLKNQHVPAYVRLMDGMYREGATRIYNVRQGAGQIGF